TLGTHIGPNRRAQAHPTTLHHFHECLFQLGLIQTLRCSRTYTFNSSFYGFTLQQITTVQNLFTFFIFPPHLLCNRCILYYWFQYFHFLKILTRLYNE